MANRFSQIINPPRFSPLSFQEQAFAPMALRQREDTLLNQRDEILNQLSNIEVPDIYQEGVDTRRQQLKSELDSLAEKIQKEGAGNLNYINDFRNLRNKYNQEVSATGVIGRAAGVKEQMDAAKTEYLNHAVNTQGQSTEAALRNWEIDKDKYLKSLPGDLSKHKGSLPELIPSSAPKYTDVVEQMKKLTDLSVAVSEKNLTGTFYFQEGPDGSIIAVDKQTEKQTNDPIINALKNELNRTLFDTNSPLNKHFRYNEINPEEYISQIDNLVELRRTNLSSDVDSYKGQLSGATSRGSKTKASGAVGATPLSTGRLSIPGTNSVKSIETLIKEAKQDASLSEEERDRQVTYLQRTAVAVQHAEQSKPFQARKAELDNEVKGVEFWEERGITNFDQYKEWVADPNNELAFYIQQHPDMKGMTQNDVKAIVDKVTDPNVDFKDFTEKDKFVYNGLNEKIRSGLPRDISLKSRKERYLNALKSHTKNIDESYSSLMNDVLEPSKIYMFREDDPSTKFTKGINTGVNQNFNFEGLDAQGVLSVADSDGKFDLATIGKGHANATQTGKAGEAHAAALAAINQSASKDVNWKLVGVDDGGLSRNAGLLFKVDAKPGDDIQTFEVVVDLDPKKLSGITRDFTEPGGQYYDQFNPEMQRVMDGIRNKIKYSDVAVDVVTPQNSASMFDKAGNNSILRNVDESLREDHVVLNQSDPYAKKLMFATPHDKDEMFAIQMHEDGYFSMHKMTPSGEQKTLTFNDLANKRAYVQGANESVLGLMQEDPDVEQNYVNWGKANVLHSIYESTNNLNTSDENNMTYNPHPKFLEAVRMYDNLYRNSTVKQRESQEFVQRASQIFDNFKLGDLNVFSKSFKVLL